MSLMCSVSNLDLDLDSTPFTGFGGHTNDPFNKGSVPIRYQKSSCYTSSMVRMVDMVNALLFNPGCRPTALATRQMLVLVQYAQAFLLTNCVELILLNANSDWAYRRNRNDLRRSINHRSVNVRSVAPPSTVPHNPKIPRQAMIP